MPPQPILLTKLEDPMQIDETKFKPFIEKKNNDNIQTIFVYIVEDQVMLLVNVQRNEIHIQHFFH